MVVVKKYDILRICLDTTDLIKNVSRKMFPLSTLKETLARISGLKVFTNLDCQKGLWQIKLSNDEDC